jgi:hypothetical protein
MQARASIGVGGGGVGGVGVGRSGRLALPSPATRRRTAAAAMAPLSCCSAFAAPTRPSSPALVLPVHGRGCRAHGASSSGLGGVGGATTTTTTRRKRRPAAATAAAALPPALGSGGGSGPSEPTFVEPLPEGLRVETDPDASAQEVSFDDASNTVKIPLKMVGDSRRTKLVMYTCRPCGHRSARLVNPLAWEKGLVFAQCQNCGVWHTLAANNPKIYEEIRYDKADSPTASSGASDQTAAAAAAAADGADGADGADADSPTLSK